MTPINQMQGIRSDQTLLLQLFLHLPQPQLTWDAALRFTLTPVARQLHSHSTSIMAASATGSLRPADRRQMHATARLIRKLTYIR